MKIPKGRNLTIVILTALSVLFGIFALGVDYVGTAGFCGQCHSMRPQYLSLKKSAHSNFPCIACHEPPGGMVTLLISHFGFGTSNLVAQISGYNTPINADSNWGIENIEKDQCTRCHSPDIRKFTARPGLKMNQNAHLKHLAAGLRCTTCHNRVAHKAKDDGEIEYEGKSPTFHYKNFLTMREGCWRCHNRSKPFKSKVNGAVAPVKCSTCHTKEFNIKPDFHANKGGRPFVKRHGKMARADMEFCQSCHENKGQIGAETGIKTCFSCHKIQFPHDTKTSDMRQNWSKIHYKITGRSRCLTCHQENAPPPKDIEAKDPDFCQKCHHRYFAKTAKDLGIDTSNLRFKKFHFKIVEAKGTEDCAQCHKSIYCAKCHVKGKKPVPGVLTKFNRNYWGKDFKAWQR